MALRSAVTLIASPVQWNRVWTKFQPVAAFRHLPGLLRWKLSLGVALSGGMGMLLARPVCDSELLMTVAGIFFGSGATSVLNQLQEKNQDRLMARTKARLLAAGIMTSSTALLLGFFCMGAAAILLGMIGGDRAVLTLASIVILYNCLYTPLKTRSACFLPFGLAAGALPPVLGWLCGGGHIFDFRALLLFTLLFLWQIPHFHRIFHRHAEDYRRAGIKTPLFFKKFKFRGDS